MSILAEHYVKKTDLENVRLETLKKEEGAQFAHPVPSERNHYSANPLREGFYAFWNQERTYDRPSEWS